MFEIGKGFFLSPQILADVGFGKVADYKTTDTVKAALGVTKAFSAANGAAALQGAYLAQRMAFETDRKGYHQNLLYDVDNQFFVKGWLQSPETAAKIAYSKAKLEALAHNEDPPDPARFHPKDFGWQLQSFFGAELGGALSSDVIQSTDKATRVARPTYPIARVRPKLAAAVDYKWIDLTLSVTPRYLFTNEIVTRETTVPNPKDATKTIQNISVKTARGFRPYGEAGINIKLTRAGNVALSSTYKLGSVPPNFDYVSTVQTGILIRY